MNSILKLLLQALLVTNLGYAAEGLRDGAAGKPSPEAREEKYRSAAYEGIRTVYGVSDACVRLAEDLAKQPVFDGTGVVQEVCKALSVGDWNLCQIFEIMNQNATKMLGLGKGKGWPVMLFDEGYSLCAKDGQVIPRGLLLGVYKGMEPCHPVILGATFEKLILTLSTGWVALNPKVLSDALKRKDPAEWNLLVKKKQDLVNESKLIGLLAVYLKLEKSAHESEKQAVFMEKDDALHWWIKKDSYDNVLKAFQLSKVSA